ncbi:hemin uptake protein HemP [Aeoliella sp. ICT_H6.2]|uniref:Hemin uptake protein HemP n=1 Tax=Aeoliella straminimaris TaxID=2954799 RepID=A0A9X2F6W7_9BACT|nr:hemin uptake protein HemP [Aeoliella straminimaris]MCO6042909.1 hemin uptake protein HemP [Aeoliella straminimaris]
MTDAPQTNAPEPPPRHIESAALLQGAREIVIEHAGQCYRLLVTKNDKLILQK